MPLQQLPRSQAVALVSYAQQIIAYQADCRCSMLDAVQLHSTLPVSAGI